MPIIAIYRDSIVDFKIKYKKIDKKLFSFSTFILNYVNLSRHVFSNFGLTLALLMIIINKEKH